MNGARSFFDWFGAVHSIRNLQAQFEMLRMTASILIWSCKLGRGIGCYQLPRSPKISITSARRR
jgi:hypothetical protein